MRGCSGKVYTREKLMPSNFQGHPGIILGYSHRKYFIFDDVKFWKFGYVHDFFKRERGKNASV